MNDKVAERVPVAVGLNSTLAVQLDDAPRLAPHVLLLMRKSPALAPPSATPLRVIDEEVPFLSVAV